MDQQTKTCKADEHNFVESRLGGEGNQSVYIFCTNCGEKKKLSVDQDSRAASA